MRNIAMLLWVGYQLLLLALFFSIIIIIIGY